MWLGGFAERTYMRYAKAQGNSNKCDERDILNVVARHIPPLASTATLNSCNIEFLFKKCTIGHGDAHANSISHAHALACTGIGSWCS